jgi:hypothetical protein
MYVANSLANTVTMYTRNTSLQRPCLGFDVSETITPWPSSGSTPPPAGAQITDLLGDGRNGVGMTLAVSNPNPNPNSDSIIGLKTGRLTDNDTLRFMFSSSAYGQSPLIDEGGGYLAIADRVQSTVSIVEYQYDYFNPNWTLGPILNQIQLGEPGTFGNLGETGLSAIKWFPNG